VNTTSTVKFAVDKFGGNTINSKQKLDTIFPTISSHIEKQHKVVVVVSAFREVTDILYSAILNPRWEEKNCIEKMAKIHRDCMDYLPPKIREELFSQLSRNLAHLIHSPNSPWVKDDILVMGERFSANILSNYLKERGVRVNLKDFHDPDFPTIVHGPFGNARIDLEKTKKACAKIINNFNNSDCIVIPGYGGISSEDGRVRTLRRGGSDYVATSISYGLSASELWIFTDVHGIKSADDSIIRNAATIPVLSVEELLSAGIYGAKVPNAVSVYPLALHCPEKTFFAKYDDFRGEKTRIVKRGSGGNPVKLVAGKDVTVCTFSGDNLNEKISKLEQQLSNNSVDFFSLGGYDQRRSLAFSVDQESYVEKEISKYENQLDVTKSHMGIVGVVGEGLKDTPGIIGRMGNTLAENKINIRYQIDVSDVSTGAIIDIDNIERAIKSLYEEFIV
jgi:aspartate kinase